MTQQAEKNPTHVIYQGKWYKVNQIGKFHGWVIDQSKEAPFMAEKLPPIQWTGAKIPWALWTKVLAFLQYSYDKTKSESQARWFYHPVEDRWDAWVFPQKAGTGMTTAEIEDHPLRAAQRAQFPSPWTGFGTIHHHCGTSAFQSGTDHDNEKNQVGVHMTVGNLPVSTTSNESLSFHTRVNCGQTLYEGHILDWVELPEAYYNVPAPVLNLVLMHMITRPIKADAFPFPQEWKDNLIETPTFFAGGGGPNHVGFHGSPAYQGSSVSHQTSTHGPGSVGKNGFENKYMLSEMPWAIEAAFLEIWNTIIEPSNPAKEQVMESEVMSSLRPPINPTDHADHKKWGLDKILEKHKLTVFDLVPWIRYYDIERIVKYMSTPTMHGDGFSY